MPRIRIPRNANAPSAGRRFVTAQFGDDPEAAARAGLLVSEMISNAVRHENDQGALELGVERDDNRARLTVSTSGDRLHDLDEARRRGAESRRRHNGGFGFAILDRLAARWGVDDGASPHVWCEISLG